MLNHASATLIVEIGSITTRVTLVDSVAGDTRLLGQSEAPSSTEPPLEDASAAMLEAAANLGDTLGRTLVQDSALVMPRTAEGDGVDAVIAVTSAAGPMAVVVAAVASDVSARSALHATRAVYTSLLQTITLNDTTDPSVGGQDHSWIERQVQRLLGLRPDVVVLAGGLEDGAVDALVRLAHIISLTAQSSRVDTDGQARQDVTVRPVVFAGNSDGRERVLESLSGRAEPIVVDNVRPSLELERLEPARRALVKLYNERILSRLPGIERLRQLSIAPVRSSSDTSTIMTRFLAEQYQRNTLVADVGSANTALFLHSQGRFSPAVLGALGNGFGVGALLAEVGTAAILRWLPFPMSERELIHTLLNKMLRPHIVPSTREELLLEQAVVREALTLAFKALLDERPDATYDMVLASGAALARAGHPAYTALTLLDALQPRADDRAVDMYVDELGLLNACGALAFADADAAVSLFEQDLLRNSPLATCVVALGGGRVGDKAVEAELRIVGGEQRTMTVAHGQIGRIELAPGEKAQLILKPSGGVRIGRNAPGAAVPTGPADISGSLLGVIIDARGRPLRLPETPIERQQMLWSWLVALGAESGDLPYAAAEPLPAMQQPEPEPIPSDIAAEPASPPPAPVAATDGSESVVSDLARLRQTVETPKKKGLFGRGK